MKKQLFRFTLSALIIYLISASLNPAIAASQPFEGNGTLFCGVIDGEWSKRYSDQYPNRRYARSFAANLNVGEPRTVRMIYLLPNDRPYRAEVVQRMKEEILKIQTFFAEQMGVHGYGEIPFHIETDPQGEPTVHRVDGGHSDTHYLDDTISTVLDEIDLAFNLEENVYLIVIDNSINAIGRGGQRRARGVGSRWGKNGGYALVSGGFDFEVTTHELGHAFGLNHDFHDGAYIMSYGPGRDRLSTCHAEYLSVHPYFNLNTPTEEGERPTIELISSSLYPAGSQSVPVRLKVNDSDGLHQLILFVTTIEPHYAAGFYEVKACRGLAGDRDTVVRFDYDGIIPSDGLTSLSDPVIHPIYVHAVDTDGDVGYASFGLVEISPHHITTFDEHTSGVGSVAFSPVDATLLATGSWDGTVQLWDVVTQQNIGTLRAEGTSVAFSSDGVTLATGSWDGTVKLWNVVTQQNIATLEVHTEGITSVVFSSDKRTLAAGSRDGTVKLWDVETEREIATFRHTEEVTSVSFSSDGGLLATGSRDRTVKLWDVATHRDIATFEEHTSGVSSVAFSPVDATLLATGSWDRTVKLWDVATRQNIATFEEHTSGVRSVVFSRDGSTLATGSWDRTVKLWDITTQVNFATLGHGDPVLSVAFSSDDTTLASGTEVGTVELWDTSGLMGVRLEATAEIDIPDPNLHAAIAEAIGLSPNTPIFQGHLENLTRLEARNANINDLTGLEGATNLRTLDLGAEYVEAENRSINSNSVSDFSPLTGLTKLRSLYLGGSNISDISTVAGLTNLRTLGLGNNNISDISAVVGLTNLTSLNLGGNNISNISAVADLTSLTDLNLDNNNVSDISAVVGLTNLTSLNLGGNSVSDISAVAGLTQLTRLTLWGNNISDISAVSDLTNLTSLNLGGNSVSDISAVAGLTQLTRLTLWNNNISDISAVSDLTNLTSLDLGGNSVSDISTVAGLTQLTRLTLWNNSISDISAVAGLTNLTDLNLDNNSVSDISAVSGLANLTRLHLRNNTVSDISPLAENAGLGDGDTVNVKENPLSYQSIHTHIPTLQSRGITVEFDNRTPTTLLNISGVITESDNVLTVEVRDSNGRIFEEVPVTFTVISGGGALSVTSATTDEKGRAQSTLTLGSDGGPNRVKVSAVGIEQTVTFSDEAEAGVHIPDPNLRAAIEEALGVKSGSPISPEEMATLTYLRARGAAIGVLIGLEYATSLTELRLGDNGITDISPLSGLTNLRTLGLGRNSVTDISPLLGLTNLRTLGLSSNGITDVSALVSVLSGLTNLTELHLRDNRITDISSLSGLTNLTKLRLRNNNITDISSLSGLTHLTELRLSGNSVKDISPLSGLTNLRRLELPSGITDVSALVRVLSSFPLLTSLNLSDSNIADVSALIPVLSGLTHLIDLNLNDNGISDISPLMVLTNLTSLNLWSNNISDISAVAGLTNLSSLHLWDNNISDISPLVENTGLGSQGWSWVNIQKNPLSYQSIHTHIPILQSRGVTVDFDDQARPTLLKILGDNQRHLPGETLAYPFVVEARDENGSGVAGVSVTFTVTEGGGTLSIISTMTDANGRAESTLTLGPNFGTNTLQVSAAGIEVRVTFNAIGDNPEFLWSIPSGYSLIHVPLKVTAVDDVLQTLTSIGDLYDALGGANTVKLLLTLDSHTQNWFVYVSPSDRGTPNDRELTDDMGIIVQMKVPVSVRLTGSPLGTNGTSTITLNPDYNLVGLPLNNSRIKHVSDLFTLEGIGGNAPVVIFTDSGDFKAVVPGGGPDDIPLIGGQAFILDAQRATTVAISGEGWYNTSETAAAPLLSLKGIEIGDTTPVLALRGSIVDEEMGVNRAGFRVIVKNLSTGRAVAAVTKGENYSRMNKGESTGVGYQVAIVDVKTGRAAKIGDNLEISVRSPSPLIGVQPLRYTVTAEDVRNSLIQLAELVAYEIPIETELLHNYPNPFNPETWIPYRLAEDAFVTLTIYDQTGHIVRTLDVGHRIASAYENRSKAIYWDGRNGFGEQVASGMYFYHLSAGDYSATRKMVILK